MCVPVLSRLHIRGLRLGVLAAVGEDDEVRLALLAVPDRGVRRAAVGAGTLGVGRARHVDARSGISRVYLDFYGYTRVLPASIPQCFYAHPDPGVLVMHNLKEMGFDLLKNQAKCLSKGLEGEEIKLYLKIARHLVGVLRSRNVFVYDVCYLYVFCFDRCDVVCGDH